MKPEELKALADRIDPEKLWSLPLLDRQFLTQKQCDQLDAAVNLRRYAIELGIANEKRAEGAMYLRGFKLERYHGGTYSRGCGTQAWHEAVNTYSDQCRKEGKGSQRMMYTAMQVSNEVPRMVMLFEMERKGLATHYKMCGLDPRPATPLRDNHLRCALGEECRACPHLAAIESSERMSIEAKDEAKAWTCATHILLESTGDTFFEGFLRDKSDDAFDARLAESFGVEEL